MINSAPNKSTNKQTNGQKAKQNKKTEKLTPTQVKVRQTANDMASAVMMRQPGGFNARSLQTMLKSVPGLKLSHDGLCFLKCAFAQPDFAGVSDKGVPDGKVGKTLLKSFRHNQSIVVGPGRRQIILQAPVPGMVAYSTTLGAGDDITAATVFTGLEYDGYQGLFPDNASAVGALNADKVNTFRIVANSIELVPTTNQMSWFGSIRAFKLMLNTAMNNVTATSVNTTLTGLQGVNSTSVDQFVTPSNLGVFMNAYNKNREWSTNPIWEATTQLPTSVLGSAYTYGMLRPANSNGSIPGFANNFETSVIIIDNPSDIPQSFILRGWQCTEFAPVVNSELYSYASELAALDPNALFVYSELTKVLPIAVSYYDNAGFWDTVSSWIKKITGMTSYIPGPVGMISKGVHDLM